MTRSILKFQYTGSLSSLNILLSSAFHLSYYSTSSLEYLLCLFCKAYTMSYMYLWNIPQIVFQCTSFLPLDFWNLHCVYIFVRNELFTLLVSQMVIVFIKHIGFFPTCSFNMLKEDLNHWICSHQFLTRILSFQKPFLVSWEFMMSMSLYSLNDSCEPGCPSAFVYFSSSFLSKHLTINFQRTIEFKEASTYLTENRHFFRFPLAFRRHCKCESSAVNWSIIL